jgi:hypothetical protein
MTVGRRVDSLLDNSIKGYRLHHGFLSEPKTSGFMFKNPSSSYDAWKRHVATASNALPGIVLAANSIDLESFYYSIRCSPAAIITELDTSTEMEGGHRDPAENALTLLLEALHDVYSVQSAEVQPRGDGEDEGALMPLPVGLPSSRVLANVVVSIAVAELRAKETVVDLAAYADDVVVLTPTLPEPLEKIPRYLERIGVMDAQSNSLLCPRAATLANLKVNVEKSGTSYSRGLRNNDDGAQEHDAEGEGEQADDPGAAHELAQLDPYLETYPSPDWGGPLRTVLRAPQRRDRVPRALERKLATLVGEIAMGLDKETTATRLAALMEGIDASVFLRLRRYWPDLAVAGISASGSQGATTLTEDFVAAIEALAITEGTPEAQLLALLDGLRASWLYALAQAIAVAMTADSRQEFADVVPTIIEDTRVANLSTQDVVDYATRLRTRGLVPPQFVSVPLSEYTSWTGRLVGAGVFAEFIAWAASSVTLNTLDSIRSRVARATRFVQLHEACLAVHLWAAPGSVSWLADAFELLASQPLVRLSDLEALQGLAHAAVSPATSALPETDDKRDLLYLRIAMPSLHVRPDQLDALLDGDATWQASIIADSRERTHIVVNAAAKRKADVLVLPEWAVLPEQLGWLMNQARRAEMLTVAGQAPSVSNGAYSNRLWTGIPLRDDARRRACLVPPPREKNHLSPHEQAPLSTVGISHVPSGPVPTYRWRGIGIASLICFEFADMSTRNDLRRGTDFLTVSSLNRDWRYFEAIQESTTRDNYCVTLCVNTSEYPGTRIMRPTGSEKAVVASVHGSDYPAVVLRQVDMLPVVAARAEGIRPSDFLTEDPRDDTTLGDYKPVPPGW